MPFVLDVDVLLLLATALAAKRRPAELGDIMAAIDLIQNNIPSEEKLQDAFNRLGCNGLLRETDGGIALSEAAETMIEALPRKGEHAERLFELKGLMAAHPDTATGSAIVIDTDTLHTALVAHRASAASGTKNMFVPKPKPESNQGRPGQRQRKPLPKSKSRKR